jgi:hypothetical protein
MALDLPQWAHRQLIKSDGVIFGEDTRKQNGVTALMHGTWCVSLLIRGHQHLQSQNSRMGIESSLPLVQENRTSPSMGESRGTRS